MRIAREPSLRILRLLNDVVPVFRGSGSLPAHAGQRQISVAPGSFLIAINSQIKELVLNDFNLRVSHSRSGKPIKKGNQRVNRFHAVNTVSDKHHKTRVCLREVSELSINAIPQALVQYVIICF